MDIGMLYYRTDLIQTPPTTRAEMQSMAQSAGLQYGYLYAGKKIEAVLDEWLEFIWGAGGNIRTPRNLQINGSTQVDALQYMYNQITSVKLAPAGTNTYANNGTLALFPTRKPPFVRNW